MSPRHAPNACVWIGRRDVGGIERPKSKRAPLAPPRLAADGMTAAPSGSRGVGAGRSRSGLQASSSTLHASPVDERPRPPDPGRGRAVRASRCSTSDAASVGRHRSGGRRHAAAAMQAFERRPSTAAASVQRSTARPMRSSVIGMPSAQPASVGGLADAAAAGRRRPVASGLTGVAAPLTPSSVTMPKATSRPHRRRAWRHGRRPSATQRSQRGSQAIAIIIAQSPRLRRRHRIAAAVVTAWPGR